MISFLYDLLYMLPIYIVSLVLGTEVLQIPDIGVIFYFLSVVIMGVTAGFKNIENKLKVFMAGLVSVIVIGIILVQDSDTRLEYIYEHIWVLWMVLIAVAVFIIGRLTIVSKWMRRIIAVALVICAVVIMWNNIAVDKIAVALIFLELLIYLAEEIQSTWQKSGGTDHKKHLVYVAPFIVSICILVYVMPASDKPYDWKFAYNAYQRVVELAKSSTRLLPGRGDEYAQVGFSETAVLAGIIQQHPKDLMELSARKEYGNIFYIAGKNFDTFTGREWTNTYIVDGHERLLDTIETQAVIREYDPDYISDYIEYANLKLRYQMFNTRYLFAPAKSELATGKLGEIEYSDRSDALVASKKTGYGTEYQLYYFRLNKDNDIFGSLVQDNKGFSEETWNEVKWNYNFGKIQGCGYNDYLRYKNDISVNYTENINISDKLQNKLDELYEGTESQWEKMKRLEAWLMTYKYTREPGKLPENIQSSEEFLDYFLLEKKEGYCVHYATAFTLLARAEGLPARFVQGCYVNKGNADTVMVTADMAHAWAEVYFDNVGWIAFDPTPGYHYDSSWAVTDRDASDNNDDERSMMDPDEWKRKYLHINENEEDNSDDVDEGITEEGIDIIVVLIPVILGLIFIMIFFFIYRMVIIRKYKSFDETRRAVIICKINLAILEKLGYYIETGETLEEFGLKIDDEKVKEALSYIPCYERIKYADTKGNTEMLEIISDSNKELLNILKNEKGYL